MADETSASIVLFADFDSANMARYERVYKLTNAAANSSSNGSLLNASNQSTLTNAASSTANLNGQSNKQGSENAGETTTPTPIQVSSQKYDVEFNVWTKPDCDDSPVGPNSNRTWFYFGVRGGYGKFLKFNMMNLNKQSRLFEMGMLPVFKTVPGHEKWSRIYTKPTWQTNDPNFSMSFIHRIPDKRDSVTYFAFCFPFSYEDCQAMLDKYDQQFQNCKNLDAEKCDPDMIYYHREIMCYSLDKRRIDLITISACNQMSNRREPRFDPDNLFPDENEKRCYKFDKKRVFVLTSRVHPGETPSSFVFNGFLEFILRRDDPRAKILRRNFVFKLIPMLNPDGVARGYYRTDQLGVNLNRVYLDPSFALHPSIYAAKSLLVYHHIYNRSSRELDNLNFDHIFKLKYDEAADAQASASSASSSKKSSTAECYTDEPTLYRSNKSPNPDRDQDPVSEFLISNDNEPAAGVNNTLRDFLINKINKNLIVIQTNRSLDVKSLFETSNQMKVNNLSKSLDYLVRVNSGTGASSRDDIFKKKEMAQTERRIGNENSDEEDENQVEFIDTTNANTTTTSTVAPDKKFYGNTYSPHLNDPKLLLINPLWSGIAFYVDLHGHAAKRGCFIYGNSIDNELFQVENVLFAKLIAFNSQHFDFDGCNFSVKNMYMKDKREGWSKEGSGRVAMYKLLGIIHSYTLECCYASGRVMNSISPAINTSGPTYFMNGVRQQYVSGTVSPPLHNDLPPKFLPEHYADVGKAVAIAALDIIEANPHTRIPNTSFGSLEAIRNWIKFFIRSKNGGGIVTAASLQTNPALAANSNSGNQAAANQNQTASNSSNTTTNNTNNVNSRLGVNSNNNSRKSLVYQRAQNQQQPTNRYNKSIVESNSNNSLNSNKSSTINSTKSRNYISSSNNKAFKTQIKKSLTPQYTNKSNTETGAPNNSRFNVTMHRKSLANLINDYETLNKKTSPVQAASNLARSETSPSQQKRKDSDLSSNTNSNEKAPTLIRSSSSLSSSETVKASGPNDEQDQSATQLPSTSTTTENPRLQPRNSSNEKFKFRKLMPISKANVLSNTLNEPNNSTVQAADSEPIKPQVTTIANRYVKTPLVSLSRGHTLLDGQNQKQQQQQLQQLQIDTKTKFSPQLINRNSSVSVTGVASRTKSGSKSISEPLILISLSKFSRNNSQTNRPDNLNTTDKNNKQSYKSYQSLIFKK